MGSGADSSWDFERTCGSEQARAAIASDGAERSQAPSRLQQRFRATEERFRAPHPRPADPFGANTKQNPICGKSNAEMEPTYNINDRLRHMGRRLPTYPCKEPCDLSIWDQQGPEGTQGAQKNNTICSFHVHSKHWRANVLKICRLRPSSPCFHSPARQFTS